MALLRVNMQRTYFDYDVTGTWVLHDYSHWIHVGTRIVLIELHLMDEPVMAAHGSHLYNFVVNRIHRAIHAKGQVNEGSYSVKKAKQEERAHSNLHQIFFGTRFKLTKGIIEQ